MSVLTRCSNFFRSRRAGAPRDRGAISALTALALIPIVGVTAVGVDGGRVFVERQRIQTAAEAAALSAAQIWATTGTTCASAATDLVASNAGSGSAFTCSTTGTRYGGVVTVTANTSVDATFGRVIGHDTTAVSSTASVRIGALGTASGVRPTAICAGNPALHAWQRGGFSGTTVYTIGIEQDEDADGYTGVCGRVPGNWGVLDFDGGSNPTGDTQRWIDHGYEHDVSIGQRFSGDPGVPSPALHLDLILGKKIIVPVYDDVTGTGSGAIYTISGFVGIEVVGSKLSGAESQRNLQVRFTPVQLTAGRPSGTAQSYGAVTWSPCSLDGKGTCS